MVRNARLVCLAVVGMALIVYPGMSSGQDAHSSDIVLIMGNWSTPFSYDLAENRSAWRPEIVVDADGAPFGVFIDNWYNESDSENFLSLLTREDDSGWLVRGISGTLGVRSHSLAVGDDGLIHMCVAIEDEVRYFSTEGYGPESSVIWSEESVESVQSDYCEVFVDGSGGVHLLYTDTLGPSLRHATLSDEGWNVETLDEVSRADALALGPGGDIHGCYYDDDEGLVYFSNSSGEWESETVDASCEVEWSLSMGVRMDGTPVATYCDWLNDNLKVAVRTPSGWVVQAVAGDAVHSSMAIDKYNNTVMTYIADGDVGFICAQGGALTWTTIQSGTQLSSPTATATDPEGYVHALYRYSRIIQTSEGTVDQDMLVYATNSLLVPVGPRNVEISDEWGGLRLTWDAEGGEGYSYDVSGYKVYRGIDEGEEVFLTTLGPDSTDYLDSSVKAGTTYYYKITSYNDEGESLLEHAQGVDTEGWDWEMGVQAGLPYSTYALIACVAIIAVLVVLLLSQRKKLKQAPVSATAEPPSTEGP